METVWHAYGTGAYGEGWSGFRPTISHTRNLASQKTFKFFTIYYEILCIVILKVRM